MLHRIPLIVIIVFLQLGCDDGTQRTLTFVLPKDFQGIILVGEAKNDASAQSGPIYQVPDSGILYVQDDSVFEQYHYLRARTPSGTPLSVNGDAIAKESARLYEIGGILRDSGIATVEWTALYYGTPAGFDDVQQEFFGNAIEENGAIAKKLREANSDK